jgi:raffinose/stachyose/melibiose transport system permease protein
MKRNDRERGIGALRTYVFRTAFLAPALLVYSFILLVPIIDSMRLSLYSGTGLVPNEFVGLANFRKILTDPSFNERVLGAFRNNIVFFLIVTAIQNVLGFFLALAVTRPVKGAAFVRKVSFLPTTLSVLVVGFLFRQMLNPIWGLLGNFPWLGNEATALPALAVAVSWQFIGESILLYAIGIDGIPREHLEAARIDGAGWLAETRYIVLPALMPIVGMVTLLIFVGDFTQFDIVYAMTTTMANPRYTTDLFGSLFYRAAFQSPVRGGWGMGMGAAVSTIMVFVVSLGVALWYYVFRGRLKGDD